MRSIGKSCPVSRAFAMHCRRSHSRKSHIVRYSGAARRSPDKKNDGMGLETGSLIRPHNPWKNNYLTLHEDNFLLGLHTLI